MRYVLVIAYFAVIIYLLSPKSPRPAVEEAVVPPPPPAPVVASPPKPQPAPPRAGDAPAPAPKASWQPPVRAIVPPGAVPTVAEMPKADSPAPFDRAGEERSFTSVATTPVPAERSESVERLVQRELSRLACLTGKAERNTWDKRSRTALRRFHDRARTSGDEPDDGLLKLLRGYPENYCKLCSPGATACAIDAGGGAQKRSEVSPPTAPQETPSYLPPWMQNEKVAKAEDAPVQSDAPEALIAPAPQVKKPPRRRAQGSSRRAPGRSRYSWPAINGWPKGR